VERKTPNFDFQTTGFLYLAAFFNCWTVLWCSIASYVVVGASETPKDVLLDSLGMLFLYNLASIGGELGFVDADDWPGDRLGWIYQEMVLKNWAPDPESDRASMSSAGLRDCIKNCGRKAAEGTYNGKPLETCCRGCANGQVHDEECERLYQERRKVEKEQAKIIEYEGGETQDWNCVGWVVLGMYNVTVVLLLLLAVVIPVLLAWTPFNLIVPELRGNRN